jgi:3-deoxy-7-phosphoheptulonate synthase
LPISTHDLDWREDEAIGRSTCRLLLMKMEFFRGISNPIGVKISNKITDEQFLNIVRKLNPNNEQGKLIIIVRMGHGSLGSKLNHLIDIKLKHNLNFLFATDPMHGNTY